MKIVIDIDENSYKATCRGSMLPPDVKNVVNAIKTGIVLPKGHGDLISRNALKDGAYINKGNFNTVEGIREWIDNAPTVTRPQMIGCFNCKHDGKTIKDEPCKYCVHHDKWGYANE